jgi:protein-S-isoprenylcysteine O-methyltransferase Ste14
VILSEWVETVLDVAWVGWLIYWLGEPLYAGVKGKSKKVAKRGRGALVSYLLLMAAFGVLQITFTGQLGFLATGPLPSSAPFDILGLVFALAGLSFMVWARVYLGSNWSPTAVLKENQELVTSGPYALVRNPIYLGLTIAVIGTGVVFGGYRVLVSITFVLLFSWVRIREEERLMSDQFGSVFQSYKERVWAFLPGVV